MLNVNYDQNNVLLHFNNVFLCVKLHMGGGADCPFHFKLDLCLKASRMRNDFTSKL